MVRIAYFDCPSGISGDMCLGALVAAGVPLGAIAEPLKQLGLQQEYTLSAIPVQKLGQAATQVEVRLTTVAGQAHRHLAEIEALIQNAAFPQRIEQRSLAIFRILAAAEAAVHGVTVEQVHFHEVGATDAIVDVVGTCLGLEWLGIEQIYCSALPTGGGTVKAAHGRLPVPVPAVLQLCQQRQVPLYSNGIETELVTPTGAAIVVALAQQFGPPPRLRLERVGLGSGQRDLPIPNLLRLWLGDMETDTARETVAILETQIDDLDSQALAYAQEQLRQAGALEVYSGAIAMKKNRLGQLLTVLCPPERVPDCEAILFRDTSTLGIRYRLEQRRILQREIRSVTTPWGKVRLKIAWDCSPEDPLQVQPEYDDCARIAREQALSLATVRQAVLTIWQAQDRG
jgi:pyridinium-3,5-bisthiocarboxylic acid mononucleotide nickel chelatase